MAFLEQIANGGNVQGRADTAQSQLAESFDTFLTLLTAQLREQDPLDPLDSNEFTQQLVQFTGVEQQIQTNQNLEQLTGLALANANSQSVTYLGRQALIESPFGDFDGDPVQWQYELPRNSETTTLEIINEFGSTVREIAGAVTTGSHDLIWDGLNDEGNPVPEGTYQLQVSAADGDGETIASRVLVSDIIRSVDTSQGAPQLRVGANTVGLADILSVTLPDGGP